MATRRKIGLIYQYNENWIAGTYYIENLVAALKLLPAEHQPRLIIFTEQPEQFTILKNKINYPFFKLGIIKEKFNLLEKGVNKISRTLTGHNYYYPFNKRLDLLFPASREGSFDPLQKKLYWIPDFQEHYLPHFFTNEEIIERKKHQANLVQHARFIVFSSNTAKKNFNEIYPGNKLRQFVLPFAVSHPAGQLQNNVSLKYNLPGAFYICSNQFWKHKNHRVILEAVAALKERGKEVYIAFTGKETDYRNPAYFEELTKSIAGSHIEKNIFFLGFISREDQLSLMKQAIAVIQPSLFEGWSTVVEDAKALNTSIIASNIDVHKEQLEEYKAKQFFDPHDSGSLVNCILNSENSPLPGSSDYHKEVLRFGQTFYSIAETIIKDQKD
jgi:glycosyltransferase involved in cell wall biosynthesis